MTEFGYEKLKVELALWQKREQVFSIGFETYTSARTDQDDLEGVFRATIFVWKFGYVSFGTLSCSVLAYELNRNLSTPR